MNVMQDNPGKVDPHPQSKPPRKYTVNETQVEGAVADAQGGNIYPGTGQSVATRSVASNAGFMSIRQERAKWKPKASGKTSHVV
ncbi:hypothetical protein CPC08DRAFT_717273 [Agrocybe pediades]|nr:hypothetical protein CPC08DRAFT_717273 [Agrocybe pediades]